MTPQHEQIVRQIKSVDEWWAIVEGERVPSLEETPYDAVELITRLVAECSNLRDALIAAQTIAAHNEAKAAEIDAKLFVARAERDMAISECDAVLTHSYRSNDAIEKCYDAIERLLTERSELLALLRDTRAEMDNFGIWFPLQARIDAALVTKEQHHDGRQ